MEVRAILTIGRISARRIIKRIFASLSMRQHRKIGAEKRKEGKFVFER